MKPLKVLIVDDNRESCDTMRLLFKALKHQAEAVYDGRTAIVKAKEMLPDFILLDIGMPDMNGWEVTQVLRQDDSLRKTRIYALTGYGEAEDIRRSHEVGMDHHFTKPLDMESFWEVLKQHIPD